MTEYCTNKESTMSSAIRFLAADAVEAAKSGHPGMPLGMADVATILYGEFLKFWPNDPKWAGRDRFILSAGHGSMLLYSLLYLTGSPDIELDDLRNFRQLGAKTAGHPEYDHLAAIETTTGPLGQGLATSVGMALAAKIDGARYGEDLFASHLIYCLVGDGCLMEGISHEAISLAGHLKLDNLVLLFDSNDISIDGATSLTCSDNQEMRFKASGWDAITIDGHNYDEIRTALKVATSKRDRPLIIICRTTIAKGAITKAGSSASHGSPLGSAEIVAMRESLNWDYEPFIIPDEVLNHWRGTSQRCSDSYKAWYSDFAKLDIVKQKTLTRLKNKELPSDFNSFLRKYKESLFANPQSCATRKSFGNSISHFSQILPELLGGSADLTGSVNTKTPISKTIAACDFSGNYIYYGIREHLMGAMMNGIALHGTMIPYAGTFLVFSDYMRSSIRLSALMKQRVIYILTHDSIGLGEDGPTHQPIEHLASLRAIPNLLVLRPADSVETAEVLQIALESKTRPSALILSRQDLPQLRYDGVMINQSSYGGYVIYENHKPLEVVIIATGSEVHIAVEAAKLLSVGVRVVSMPSIELFFEQSLEYQREILGDQQLLRVAVEAAVRMSFDRFLKDDDIFIGMNSFGESAPADQLYKKFAITTDAIVLRIMTRLHEYDDFVEDEEN